MLLGPAVVAALGPKRTLVLAESFSTSYAVLFACATTRVRGGPSQWALYVAGSVLGGAGAGLLSVAHGTFFQRTVAVVAGDQPPEATSAELGGRLASIVLLSEFAVKTATSLLQGKFLQWQLCAPLVDLHVMFFCFAAVAGIMTFAMSTVADPPVPHDPSPQAGGALNRMRAAFELWRGPTIWCLGVMNVLFGVCAAYMNGFVNASFADRNPEFGVGSLGSLAAGTCLVAAACAELFARVGKRTGKGFVMGIGSVVFFIIPSSIMLHTPRESNRYWGQALASLYLLQGIGRGVYESTNKAVFSDFFTGSQAPAAFANVRLQNSFGFFGSFVLQGVLGHAAGHVLARIVVVMALLVMPCFHRAWTIRRKSENKAAAAAQPLLA